MINHLVEDVILESYMRHLFSAARKYVITYNSSAVIFAVSPYVRHCEFTTWVATNQPGRRLAEMVPNIYPVGAGHCETSLPTLSSTKQWNE